MIKIFVYGTLKEGFPLDEQYTTKRKSVVKNVKTSGTLFNLGPFPGAKFNTKDIIVGEIHKFKDAKQILSEMDVIEGYNHRDKTNSLFYRIIIEATYKNGKKVKAYAYEFNFDKYNNIKKRIIKTGIWEKGAKEKWL